MDIKQKFSFVRAEFFDIFGVFIWVFFIVVAGRALLGAEFPHWAIGLVFIVAVLGLIVNGIIVFKTYLKKK